MTDPFSNPSSSTGIDWSTVKGSLLLIDVLALDENIPTVHGETDAIRANVAVLDGDTAPARHDDILIFPRVLKSQLKSRIGGKVLGRLSQGTAKPGQSAPWVLGEYSEADAKVARKYLEDNPAPAPTDPFA